MKAEEVTRLLGENAREVRVVNERCLFARTDPEKLHAMLRELRSNGVTHISAITGVDTGENIEVIYHFDCRPAELNLKISLPKSDPRIWTITEIYPGAVFYERDLMEMLGVKVEGHPNPKRLFLPDDWPEGEYPLRREWREKRT